MELAVVALSIVVLLQQMTVGTLARALAAKNAPPKVDKPAEKPVERKPAFYQTPHGVMPGEAK